MAWAQSYANQVARHVERRDSSAIEIDTVETAFISVLPMKRLTVKEMRKAEYPEKTPDDELQKMPHTKARKFKPQPRDPNPHSSIDGRLKKKKKKSTRANHYTTRLPNYLTFDAGPDAILQSKARWLLNISFWHQYVAISLVA